MDLYEQQHEPDHIFDEYIEMGWCDHCAQRARVKVIVYNNGERTQLCKDCQDK